MPRRFLQDGFLSALGRDELSLYLFLVLAADRFGMSFYHYDRICSLLTLSLEDYIEARNRLIKKDLVAFDGTRFQVLSLPERTVFDESSVLRTEHDFECCDPATIRTTLQRALK